MNLSHITRYITHKINYQFLSIRLRLSQHFERHENILFPFIFSLFYLTPLFFSYICGLLDFVENRKSIFSGLFYIFLVFGTLSGTRSFIYLSSKILSVFNLSVEKTQDIKKRLLVLHHILEKEKLNIHIKSNIETSPISKI